MARAEATVRIKIGHRNVRIQGDHVAAGSVVDVSPKDARMLVGIRKATLSEERPPKPKVAKASDLEG